MAFKTLEDYDDIFDWDSGEVEITCGPATDRCKATTPSCAATNQTNTAGVESIIQNGLATTLTQKNS